MESEMEHHVHLFVFDSMSDWEYGYAVAGINNPHLQRNPGAGKELCKIPDRRGLTDGESRGEPKLFGHRWRYLIKA